MSLQSKKLFAHIFRHYFRSALLPILTIEILLLAVYFLVNSYNNYAAEKTLQGEVTSVIPHLVSQQSSAINGNFTQIARQTAYFAEAHRGLTVQPRNFTVAGEEPQFAVATNGVYYQTNLRTGSSLFYAATTRLGEREKLLARHSVALNPLYEHMVRDIPNVAAAYFNTRDNMNRLYPFIDKAYTQYPPDLQMANYNFYYLADAAHNPQKKPAWTGVYLDPAGNGWMLSCVAPVYEGAELEGVVGLDVTVENIVKNTLALDLPWGASAFLVDDQGMILAMSEKVETLFGLKELKQHVYNETIKRELLKPENYNIFKHNNKRLAAEFVRVFNLESGVYSLDLEGRKLFLAQGRIKETGWRMVVVVEHERVFQSVQVVARVSRMIGYGVICCMVVFYLVFFAVLRKSAGAMAAQIAEPVAALAQATSQVGTADAQTVKMMVGIEELDLLKNNFNQMARELDVRSTELVKTKVQASLQEKEAELAYAKGLCESASGYLHNVGNSITRLNSSLMDLDEIVRSSNQYPAVFQKLKGGNAPDTLQRFEEVLLNKVVPRLQKSTRDIYQIKEHIQQTIKFQLDTFMAPGNRHSAIEFNLSDLIQQVDLEMGSEVRKQGIELIMDVALGVKLRNHRNQIYHGVVNLIKNAKEAIGGGRNNGKIQVSLAWEKDKAILSVKDNGEGIAPENMDKIMTAGFTTKPDGHGLGLHSLAVFLTANAGKLSVSSPGVGQGAQITMEVGNV
jgi:C4-dicarboxylate-specific signal transduction histidine kinase